MSAVSIDDDSALVARAAAGDTAAFEALVERHQSRVYALALRMLNSEEDAAEVLQDSFVSAWRNLTSLRGEQQFGAWLKRIAANFALMKLRHRKVQGEVASIDEPTFNERGSLVDEVVGFDDGESAALNHELRGAIEAAAKNLGAEYREVFVLRDLEGMSYEEIAELTQATVPAIKSRLHRARLSLRAAIDEYYAERVE